MAFHLFTKTRHDTQVRLSICKLSWQYELTQFRKLAEHPVPEMLRLSLQDLALRIKILRVKLGSTIEEVLLKALDPPSSVNIQRAISALVEVKALTSSEEITPMGRLLSKLPVDVHLGKFLLFAALTKCLDPALTIAATLNSKSPFLTPFGHEFQADAAKKRFAVGMSLPRPYDDLESSEQVTMTSSHWSMCSTAGVGHQTTKASFERSAGRITSPNKLSSRSRSLDNSFFRE